VRKKPLENGCLVGRLGPETGRDRVFQMIVALGEIKSEPTPETIGKIPESNHD
jgi:hypothetical protein